MIYLTSDPHLGHGTDDNPKIINMCNRPFGSITEMDEAFIDQWNSLNKPNDTLIIAGDFAWHNPEYYARRLHGQVILIPGNHDMKFKMERLSKLFHMVRSTLSIKWEERDIFISHYAHLVWHRSQYGALHAFGHSHGNLKNFMPNSWDVGWDNNNYKIISMEEFIEKATANNNTGPFIDGVC